MTPTLYLAAKLRRRLLAATTLVVVAFAMSGGLLAQQFPTTLERFFWKELAPWGVQNPAGTARVPVLDEIGDEVFDEFGQQVFMTDSDAVDPDPGGAYAAAFAELLPGECTFSQLGDRDVIFFPRIRQCKDANGNPVPPPLGALMNPVSLAVDGTRVYVSDEFNHRIQVFDFFGNPTPLPFPIGNGVPGSGTYTYGPEAGNATGEMLRAPYGVAVDAAGKILVADGGNSRVAIFNNNGARAFTTHKPIETGAAGQPSWPSLVTLSPDAVALEPGSTPPPSAANDRIVVTDWYRCSVNIYDTGFNLIRQIPSVATYQARPPTAYQHDACLDPESTVEPGPGEFSTVTGAAIDANGYIYISDHAQSVVQVFDRDGNHVGWIGRPSNTPAPAALSGPVGLTIDHLGRLGVTDAGNARVAFYKVTFPNGAPVATFQFQLDTTVAVDDFPMGLEEQIGPRPDLDPKGRFLATDPLRRRVLRFELPELAIVNQQADNGQGSYDVAVPLQKASAVVDVTTTVTPQENDVTVTDGPLPSAPVTIQPGQLQNYTFTYDQQGPTATFLITAEGDAGNAVADPKEAEARLACTSCDAEHTVYRSPIIGAPVPATLIAGTPTGDWYNHEVYVRLVPTGTEEVTHIAWFLAGEASYIWGSATTESPVSGATPYVDVPDVRLEGASSLTYWAITADGTAGPRHTVPLNLDLRVPVIRFENWTPLSGVDASGTVWRNTPVTADFFVKDNFSGMASVNGVPTADPRAVATGAISLPVEGRNVFTVVNALDHVGLGGDYPSNTSSGGTIINIDMTAPYFCGGGQACADENGLPQNVTIAAMGRDANGGYAVLAPGAFDAQVFEPLLTDGGAGSGVKTLSNPGSFKFRMGANPWTFVVTDYAGNVRQATRTVTVLKAPSTVQYTGTTSAGYLQPVVLRAAVGPVWATGTVTFTIGSQVFGPVAVVNGLATFNLPGGSLPAGTSSIQVAYSGDDAVLQSQGTGSITVDNPQTIIVRANPKTKVYGSANPPLDAVIEGAPAGAQITYSLSTTATLTSGVGSYPITVSVTPNPNYDIQVVPSTLQVTPKDAAVGFVSLVTRMYGDPVVLRPSDAWVEGTIPGDSLVYTLSSTANELSPVGDYPITINLNPADNPNYNVTVFNGTLRMTRRPATVTATATGKVYRAADPALAVTHSGFLDRDVPSILFEAERLPGEDAGQYRITPYARGGASANYEITQLAAWFTINKALATVAVNNKTKVYGDTNPALDAVLTGVLSGDTITYTLSTAATPASVVGGYAITASVQPTLNYAVTVQNGTLTVMPRPATVIAGNEGKVYGNPDPAIPASGVGFLSGDAITLTGTRAPGQNVGPYATSVIVGGAAAGNYTIIQQNGVFTITPRAITVTAQNAQKGVGQADPALGYTLTAGSLVAGDAFSGALTRAAGETPGTYAITQGTLTLGPNYTLVVLPGLFTITANLPPDAVDDAAAVPGTSPMTIPVLVNDTDPDGNTLTITSVTQPANGAGTVVIVGNAVVFTPSPNFAGTATFTYTISDGQGGFDTATVTLTSCSLAGYRTQSQGGWGAKPSGGNAGAFLHANFARVYPNGQVRIGGTYSAVFTSAQAITTFLPQGGTPGVLTTNYTNPKSFKNGNLAAQVLALQLSVDFSTAGVTRQGLGNLILAQGPLMGWTVSQVLATANAVLGGNLAALPQGMTISTLNSVVDALNNNFVDGTANLGYLVGAGCTPNAPPDVVADDQSNRVGEPITLPIDAADPNHDTLVYSASGLPPGLTINPLTGVITGTPAAIGTYAVIITVTDPSGAVAQAAFRWTVTQSNRAPLAAADTATTKVNTPVTIAVRANDSDPDGDTLTITSVTQPASGGLVTISGGSVTYTPASNWKGTTTFSYTIADGKGGTAMATVTVTVTRTTGGSCDDDHDHDRDCDRDDDERDEDCWYSSKDGDRDHGTWGSSKNYGRDSWSKSYDGYRWRYTKKW